MLGNKSILNNDIFAAGALKTRDEPGVASSPESTAQAVLDIVVGSLGDVSERVVECRDVR